MKKQKNIPLLAAVVICAVSVLCMCFALGRETRVTVTFTPPPFEASAVAGTPEVAENLGWSEVDARVFQASVCGVVAVSEGKADVFLTNPESNSVWLKLRVQDEAGEILGETGIIRPGEYVQTVTFSVIPESGEKIGLKLMAYEPETYYSAGSVVLNTTVSEGGSQ